MSAWRLSKQGEARAREAALGNASLFGSTQWAYVIEGLGCQSVLAWNEELQLPVVVPVFRRGPLRIGFLGFPLAGGAFDALTCGEFDRHAAELARELKLDIVRGTRCGLTDRAPGECLPEVWTENLPDWPGALGKRLRRDLAFAERACAGVSLSDRGGDPSAWHALYATAVRAHGGKLRYTPEYFCRLAAAAQDGAALRVFHASDASGRTLGFAVLAVHQRSGYYLHGAVDASARKTGLSDLMLWRLMSHARESGLQRFSLMASPAAQEGLVRFKGKWADRQGYSVTRDLARGALGTLVLGVRGLLVATGRGGAKTDGHAA